MDAEAEEGDADASDAKRRKKQEEEVSGQWLGGRRCSHTSPSPTHLRRMGHTSCPVEPTGHQKQDLPARTPLHLASGEGRGPGAVPGLPFASGCPWVGIRLEGSQLPLQ